MLKTWGRWLVRLVGNQSLRGALMFVVVCGALLWGSQGLTATRAVAQEAGSTRALAPASGNSATINTEDEAAAGADGKGATRGEASESFLTSITHASTPVIVVTLVIATMSFYLIALVVWMGLHYRSTVAVPRDLVRDTQSALEQKKYNEAYQRLVEDPSFLAQVVASGVRKLPAGLSHAQRAMELTNENVTMEMEHRTTYLATVGTLGPMIGLVGTVYGMIMAFHVIAQEGATPQASQLAAGISTALYATLEGIAISIPAIFFYAMFRNRIARLSLEVGIAAEPLLEQFVPGVRQTMPGPTVNHGPVQAPSAHPHPFAVTAALAATGGIAPRPALPATEP
jgi:biopolymer transport protein ExbB